MALLPSVSLHVPVMYYMHSMSLPGLDWHMTYDIISSSYYHVGMLIGIPISIWLFLCSIQALLYNDRVIIKSSILLS